MTCFLTWMTTTGLPSTSRCGCRYTFPLAASLATEAQSSPSALAAASGLEDYGSHERGPVNATAGPNTTV